MGSFNVGCLFSSLPIEHLNPVVSYIIMKEKLSHSFMYETNYRPAPVPFIGKYDDYGFFDQIENPENVDKFLNFINKTECKYSDSFVEVKNLYDFYDRFIRGEEGFFKYNVVFFHKEIYSKILNDLFYRKYNDEETTKEYFCKKLKNSLKKDKEELSNSGFLIHSELNYFCPTDQEIIASKNEILMLLDDSYVDDLVETKMICNALCFLRKNWDEGIVGSQNAEFYIQKLISESTLDYIEKYKKDLLENPYSDEDLTEENIEENLKERIR